MANLILLFAGLLGDFEFSYKTIELAYSNLNIRTIIRNIIIILVERKGIKQAELTRDGT